MSINGIVIIAMHSSIDEQHSNPQHILTRDLYAYSRIGLAALIPVNIVYSLSLVIGTGISIPEIISWCVPMFILLVLAALLLFPAEKKLKTDLLRVIALNAILTLMGALLGISIVYFFSRLDEMIIMVMLVLTAGTLAAAGSCLASNRYSFIALSIPWVFPIAVYLTLFTGKIYFIAIGPLIVLFESFLIIINYGDYKRRRAAILLDFSLKGENEKLEEAKNELDAALEEMEAANDSLAMVNRELEEAENEYAHDMQIASSVQVSLLPREVPFSQKYDLAFYFQPMEGVSGDFYDFYISDNEIDGVGIFEVSGNGISPGLLTLIAKSIIFRSFTNLHEHNLGIIMHDIHVQLTQEIGQVNHYVTGILVKFKHGSIEYVNCGHPDMIYKRIQSNTAGSVTDSEGNNCAGPFLGINNDDTPILPLTLQIDRGDTFIIFTDCLINAINSRGQAFGQERIIELLENCPEGSAQEILDWIMDDFFNFVPDKNNLGDDITAILIKRK